LIEKKENGIVVVDIARREKDHVTLGEDGMDTLHLLLAEGRREHARWLKTQFKKGDEWAEQLKFRDKIIERLFFSAKRVVVEVDWSKWYEIEKEVQREMRRLNR
jgi:hypothetical protein